MIQFEHTEVHGFRAALRGMRNPLDSWRKSDSVFRDYGYTIGEADHGLAERLIGAGDEHAKFLRQIVCWTDITAPRFWWIEFDTYRVGVEKDSCSTMHTIMREPFTQEAFSDRIPAETVAYLNELRDLWRAAGNTGEAPEVRTELWRRLIAILPQSYLQKRTVMMSYAAIRNMVRQRKGHKLQEWAEFIAWANALPDSWMLKEARG